MKFVLSLLLLCSVCWAAIVENQIMDTSTMDDVSSSADPKPCCFPSRWRGKMGNFVSFRSGRRAGSAAAMAHIFTDLQIGKMAVNETVLSRGRAVNITTVADFNNSVMYIVRGHRRERCLKVDIPNNNVTMCIPQTAKYIGSPTFGMGSNVVKTSAFDMAIRKKKMNTFLRITVTSNNCAPVHETGFSQVGPVRKIFRASFFDLKSDIPDPTVFDLPQICQNSTAVDSVPQLTDLQDYLFNIRFTF